MITASFDTDPQGCSFYRRQRLHRWWMYRVHIVLNAVRSVHSRAALAFELFVVYSKTQKAWAKVLGTSVFWIGKGEVASSKCGSCSVALSKARTVNSTFSCCSSIRHSFTLAFQAKARDSPEQDWRACKTKQSHVEEITKAKETYP